MLMNKLIEMHNSHISGFSNNFYFSQVESVKNFIIYFDQNMLKIWSLKILYWNLLNNIHMVDYYYAIYYYVCSLQYYSALSSFQLQIEQWTF